jgi:hypothetical protein
LWRIGGSSSDEIKEIPSEEQVELEEAEDGLGRLTGLGDELEIGEQQGDT